MSDVTVPAEWLERLDAQFPARTVAVGQGAVVSVRECGPADSAVPLVCLHGIGSGSASWLDVALALGERGTRVMAWDAPGYGASTPLPHGAPCAADYAQRLHQWLDTMQVQRCVLVGHSLGALIAAKATHMDTHNRIAALRLISPAQGYGAPGREAERARMHGERMRTLHDEGIAGMAARRSGRLLSEFASAQARQWVHWNMARLNERGYFQAIELLCGGDLLADLPAPVPTVVMCGLQDVITPAAGCLDVAAQGRAAFHGIPLAGHACYVEQPEAFARWLRWEVDEVKSAP